MPSLKYLGPSGRIRHEDVELQKDGDYVEVPQDVADVLLSLKGEKFDIEDDTPDEVPAEEPVAPELGTTPPDPHGQPDDEPVQRAEVEGQYPEQSASRWR